MRIAPDEIRLIAFVIIALVVGAGAKHWRSRQVERATREANPPLLLPLPQKTQN